MRTESKHGEFWMFLPWAVLIGAVLLLMPGVHDAWAQAGPEAETKATVEEELLALRITQAVLKALQDSPWLEHQIERGIDRYIKKQEVARKTAREKQTRQFQEKAKHVRPVSATRDHIWGNPDAPVSLIEYSDFECPFCKRFHPTPKQIVDASKGTVNWVYRHFPLPFHNPGAQKQAEAAECANEIGGNEVFWQYADAIYTRTTSNGNGFPVEKLVPLATELGMDESAFRTCLDSGRYAARVMEDLEEGQQLGITGTPATIMRHHSTGNVRVQSGASSVSKFVVGLRELVVHSTGTPAHQSGNLEHEHDKP